MFNSIDNYTDKGKFKEWLTEIARNISKNKVTRDKEKNTIYDDEIIGSAKSEKSNIDIIYIQRNHNMGINFLSF